MFLIMFLIFVEKKIVLVSEGMILCCIPASECHALRG